MTDVITYQPTEEEWPHLRKMAADQGLSLEALVRQSLRLYSMHLKRLSDGETVTYSGDAARAAAFAGTSTVMPESQGD